MQPPLTEKRQHVSPSVSLLWHALCQEHPHVRVMRRAERRGADALCAVSFARACRLDWKRRWQAPLPSTCIPRAPHASALPAVHSRVAKAGTPPARVKHHPVPAQDNSPSTFSAQSPAATHVVALNETSPSSHTTHRVPSARPHVQDASHFPPTRTTSRGTRCARSPCTVRARSQTRRTQHMRPFEEEPVVTNDGLSAHKTGAGRAPRLPKKTCGRLTVSVILKASPKLFQLNWSPSPTTCACFGEKREPEREHDRTAASVPEGYEGQMSCQTVGCFLMTRGSAPQLPPATRRPPGRSADGGRRSCWCVAHRADDRRRVTWRRRADGHGVRRGRDGCHASVGGRCVWCVAGMQPDAAGVGVASAACAVSVDGFCLRCAESHFARGGVRAACGPDCTT